MRHLAFSSRFTAFEATRLIVGSLALVIGVWALLWSALGAFSPIPVDAGGVGVCVFLLGLGAFWVGVPELHRSRLVIDADGITATERGVTIGYTWDQIGRLRFFQERLSTYLEVVPVEGYANVLHRVRIDRFTPTVSGVVIAIKGMMQRAGHGDRVSIANETRRGDR